MFTRLSDIMGAHKDSLESRRQESVVPMINVVFLLLLYFMVAGSLQLEDLTVSPPESSALAEPPHDVPQLLIAAGGGLWYEGRAVSLESLAGILEPDRHAGLIRLAADANIDAVLVADVIDGLSEIGFKEVILLSVRRRGASVTPVK